MVHSTAKRATKRSEMQTFLPYPNRTLSARTLDPLRRNNQVNEAMVILKTLLGLYPSKPSGRPGGWPHHPATKMWRGYERWLCVYAIECARAHNRQDGRLPALRSIRDMLPNTGKPDWWGDEAFHASHRSNLLRKNPTFYSQYGWSESDDLPYVWPEREHDEEQ